MSQRFEVRKFQINSWNSEISVHISSPQAHKPAGAELSKGCKFPTRPQTHHPLLSPVHQGREGVYQALVLSSF